MFAVVWHDFLYQPLFNALIWLYANVAGQNLGWAVVWLTVLLRIVLLPFTLVTEKNKIANDELSAEVDGVRKDTHMDPVTRKEEVRKILKKRRISPWSKFIVLGVQILVLILLYQVFLRGVTGEKMAKILYFWLDFPGKINTVFYGFDLGQFHTIIWPGVAAIWLLVEFYLDYRHKKTGLTKADLAYFLLFPAFSFFALWLLPMVKSLFILTSMAFSVIIHWFSILIFKPKVVKTK